jgi:predicted dehydrogenase
VGSALIRVALIGYGYAGRTFHAPLIRATPGFELVLVCSSRPERIGADLPGVAIAPAALEAFAARPVDLVVIATPPDSHAPLATAALRAGKHVVVDKPLAPTLDEARALAAIATSTQRLLAVFQNRRWDGDFLALADLLERGVLGDVSHLESHFDRYRPHVRNRWREQPGAGAGIWQDLGPHLVDQALQLHGLPNRLMASFATQRAESQVDDWAHVVLEYSRLRVVLHASVLVAAPSPRFIVHGQQGSWIKYGFDAQERQLVAALTAGDGGGPGDTEHAVLVDGASGAQEPMPVPPGDYRQFYVRLRDALGGAGCNPVPPAQAVAVTAVIETAMRSSAEGQPLTLPLTETECLDFRR